MPNVFIACLEHSQETAHICCLDRGPWFGIRWCSLVPNLRRGKVSSFVDDGSLLSFACPTSWKQAALMMSAVTYLLAYWNLATWKAMLALAQHYSWSAATCQAFKGSRGSWVSSSGHGVLLRQHFALWMLMIQFIHTETGNLVDMNRRCTLHMHRGSSKPLHFESWVK